MCSKSVSITNAWHTSSGSCPTNSKTTSKSTASRFAVRGRILGNRESRHCGTRACPLRALSFDFARDLILNAKVRHS